MNKNILKKGKRQLILMSTIFLVLAIALAVVGIILAIQGYTAIGTETALGTIILKAGFGTLMTIFGLIFIAASVVMLWTGAAMKTNLGNTLDESIPKGTLNMKKCQRCGREIKENEEFCGNCGAPLSSKKKCKSCGAENDQDKKFCIKCGKEM